MKSPNPYPMLLIPLLCSPLIVSQTGASELHLTPSSSSSSLSSSATADNRKLTVTAQNVCGTGFGDAQASCAARCPQGIDSECPPGQTCFAGVMCPEPPKPPTVSPAPTRSPLPAYDIGNHDKTIIGYYAGWQWYDRSKLAKPSNMDFSKITRVNYAFFQFDTSGNIWGTDEWADPRVLYGDVTNIEDTCGEGSPGCKCSWTHPDSKTCTYHNEATGLIKLVHDAGKTIYPSIGGWTLSDPFPAMSKDPTSRGIFVANAMNLVKDYDFDGVDIDWEYPGYAAHSGTPDDTESFNYLMRDLREGLDALEAETGKTYKLSAALPCGPANIANIDVEFVSDYIDEFNLMTYDFHGSWDALTGVNSPLYDQDNDPEPGWSVHGCVENWASRGAPKERLNIGLGFYGRSFRGATALKASHGGNDDANWPDDEGSPQYFNIVKKLDEMTSVRDDETKTQFAYFNDGGGLVSYDDEQSICDKTEYAMDNGLHGYIIWELSGDVMEDLSTPLLDILNRKLVVTKTDCANPYAPLAMSNSAAVTVPATVATATTTKASAAATSAITSKATNAATTTQATTAATTTATTTTSSSTTNKKETISVASDMFAADELKRKPVRRNDDKPEKPYRPPKEETAVEL